MFPSNDRTKKTSGGTPSWINRSTFSNPNCRQYCGCPTKQQPFALRSFKRDNPSRISAFPMPLRWKSGCTETGPRPYQSLVPSDMVTGENAICPATRLSTSATNDNVRAFADRNASMINCSVWLLISIDSNAAIVIAEMIVKSVLFSSLINMFCIILAISFSLYGAGNDNFSQGQLIIMQLSVFIGRFS